MLYLPAYFLQSALLASRYLARGVKSPAWILLWKVGPSLSERNFLWEMKDSIPPFLDEYCTCLLITNKTSLFNVLWGMCFSLDPLEVLSHG